MYVSKSTGIKEVESIAPKSVTKNQWLNNYGLPIRICLQQNLNKWELKINYYTTTIGENWHLFNRCGTGTSVAQHQCPLNRCLNLSCPLMLKEGITPIYHPLLHFTLDFSAGKVVARCYNLPRTGCVDTLSTQRPQDNVWLVWYRFWRHWGWSCMVFL